MKLLEANIGAGVIALILGEILAYIDSQLETMTPDYLLTGILAVVFGLVAANCVYFITRKAEELIKRTRKASFPGSFYYAAPLSFCLTRAQQ